MEQMAFDKLSEKQKKIQILADMVRGTVKKEEFGMEKSVSIRLNSKLYPLIRALADNSGTSMNTLVTELLEVSLDVLFENLNEDEEKNIREQAQAIYSEWFNEIMQERGAK